MAVSGELRTKPAVLFKEQVNHPNRKTMCTLLPACTAEKPEVALKCVKLFGTKGPVLNIDKRNSRRAAVVHTQKNKALELRKGTVSCETHYSKMTGSGFTGRERIRKLTWHRSFMQTDLTYPHQIYQKRQIRRRKYWKSETTVTQTTLLKIASFQTPASHIRILVFHRWVY